MDWKNEARQELEGAQTARLSGNEGRARVCARRAAGHVVGEYFHRQTLPDPGLSAYARLQSLVALPYLSPQTRAIAGHFVLRTTPDFILPVEADLIEEVNQLAVDLLGENLEEN